jgi:hypothetical protein
VLVPRFPWQGSRVWQVAQVNDRVVNGTQLDKTAKDTVMSGEFTLREFITWVEHDKVD